MIRRHPPMLLGLTVTVAAMTCMDAFVSAGAAVAEQVKAPPTAATPPPDTRMGAMVADDLAKRDAAARARARAVDLQEQAAKAAAARLQSALKAEAPPAANPAAPAPAAGAAPSQPDQFDTLARIYQAMKPAKAAPVFEQLDLEVQYLVAKKMRERSAALLMGAMSPEGAARLSMRMAGRMGRAANLPSPGKSK
ncbi:MAG: hypothetical protein LKF30_11865 [Sphingobium sp.]|jgi:flagellar motility protein MotE (MotC chaperone)|nr:hypothetical protein [Sphingobium sp.]MCI1271342.1 hypothetical protein [Sphingobium sp.]MCI1756855.1 hypothetical protein [Sphingobium sp.]MCI2053975.1 hypothetical protein [Sphingobium sp.]